MKGVKGMIHLIINQTLIADWTNHTLSSTDQLIIDYTGKLLDKHLLSFRRLFSQCQRSGSVCSLRHLTVCVFKK